MSEPFHPGTSARMLCSKGTIGFSMSAVGLAQYCALTSKVLWARQ